jgi:hypothetical protein
MAIPQPMMMDGIGSLAPLNSMLARQTRRRCLQELMGCEAKTEFKFSTMENQQNPFLYGLEESGFCIRLVCGPNRPFVMNVSMGSGPGGPLAMVLDRPFRCAPGMCKCCCFQELSVMDAQGTQLGSVKEQWWICVPKVAILKGQTEDVEYVLSQPTCVGGMCVDCMAEGCCNCRIPFYLYPPGVPTDKDNKIGKIVKVWTGAMKELFTDADNFEVEFPPGIDAQAKARILGALILTNQMFFEGGND